MTPRRRNFFGVALAAAVLDQASKLLVTRSLPYGEEQVVIQGFLHLTHVRNSGTAFGLFSEATSEVKVFLFALVFAFAALVVRSFYARLAPGDGLSAAALGSVLGGAVGNLIDRVAREGSVIDFLRFQVWGGYEWPDFNLADVFIMLGVAALMLDLLAAEGKSRAQVPRSDGEAS